MSFVNVLVLLALFFLMALISAFVYLIVKSKLDQIARAALVDKTITSVVHVLRDLKGKGGENV